jgi:hypothetical protein
MADIVSELRGWEGAQHPGTPLARTLGAGAAEIVRLQAVLDAERGVRGPEGWVWNGPNEAWLKDGDPKIQVFPDDFRERRDRWKWVNRYARRRGHAPTALEAMQAADRAGGEAP